MRSWLSVEHAALKGRGFVALSSITYYNIPAHKQILSGRSCGLDLDYLYLFLAAPLFDLAVFGRFLRSCIWIWSKYQILFVFVCFTDNVWSTDSNSERVTPTLM